MKNLINSFAIVLSIILVFGCGSTGNNGSSEKRGLVPVHLTANSDSSANVSFDSSIENILNKEVPLEFKAGARWQSIETTQYVLPAVAILIAQGKMKVTVSQEKTSDGGIKNSISFELK